jgi:hypothetical protein
MPQQLIAGQPIPDSLVNQPRSPGSFVAPTFSAMGVNNFGTANQVSPTPTVGRDATVQSLRMDSPATHIFNQPGATWAQYFNARQTPGQSGQSADMRMSRMLGNQQIEGQLPAIHNGAGISNLMALIPPAIAGVGALAPLLGHAVTAIANSTGGTSSSNATGGKGGNAVVQGPPTPAQYYGQQAYQNVLNPNYANQPAPFTPSLGWTTGGNIQFGGPVAGYGGGGGGGGDFSDPYAGFDPYYNTQQDGHNYSGSGATNSTGSNTPGQTSSGASGVSFDPGAPISSWTQQQQQGRLNDINSILGGGTLPFGNGLYGYQQGGTLSPSSPSTGSAPAISPLDTPWFRQTGSLMPPSTGDGIAGYNSGTQPQNTQGVNGTYQPGNVPIYTGPNGGYWWGNPNGAASGLPPAVTPLAPAQPSYNWGQNIDPNAGAPSSNPLGGYGTFGYSTPPTNGSIPYPQQNGYNYAQGLGFAPFSAATGSMPAQISLPGTNPAGTLGGYYVPTLGLW